VNDELSLPERVAELSRVGLSDPAVAARLGLSTKAAARMRRAQGIAPYNTMAPSERLKQYTRPMPDGHTGWSGALSSRNTPIIYFGGRNVPACRVVFQQHHGRVPVGQVRPECGQRDCLTASHLADDRIRRTARLVLRDLNGLQPHWTDCPGCGADWETSGRVQPDLHTYCTACYTRRSRRNRERKTT